MSETVRTLLSVKVKAIVAYKHFGQGLSCVEAPYRVWARSEYS